MKRRGFFLETLRQWMAILVLGLFGLGIIRVAHDSEMWHLHIEGEAAPTVAAPLSVYGNASAYMMSYSWNGAQTSLTARITPRLDSIL
jgi:hypothetical protein